MKNLFISLYNLFPVTILVLLSLIPSAQLTTSENRILLRVQKLLEYPQALQEWTNMTNFCSLSPSASLNIVCSDGHVTELSIIGNKTSSSAYRTQQLVSWNSSETLSERFSIQTFFTVLTKLSNLKVLSLVSLGLWGPLSSKIDRLRHLEVLNISSNLIYGQIPSSITSLKSLRSLVLADNHFSGSVPDLGRLVSLAELNLSGNKLGPEFPSLSKNLVRVVLRNNSLRCRIPLKLIHVYKLQLFDISSNAISGNIPSFIFSLPFLKYLNLAANQLNGSLSMNVSCSSALTFIDISHNLLVGTLPSCLASKALNRTKVEALAVKPSIRSQKESEVQLGLIHGIIGGVVGISGLLVLLFLCIFRKFRPEKADSNYNIGISSADKLSVHAYPRPNTNARRVPLPRRRSVLGFPPYCNFSLEEIEDATNNFDPSNLIAQGSQRQLYKGWLIDGSMVMVNHVKLKQKSLHKNNIQSLKDRPQMISTIFIVFEHVSNMSLRDYLADTRRKEMLKWPQRMAICIGIARGIQFLHTRVHHGIFGNNIKIENILLDDSLDAKVSGYSIPWPSKISLDSNLSEQRALNQIGSTNNAEKEDIYQFGVILLEVITGKLITSSSEVEKLKDEMERCLAASPSLRDASPILKGLSDSTIQETSVYESLRTAVQITISCLNKVSSNRPSMEDILWNLLYSMQVQEPRISDLNLFTKM
ncbi:hypothetical protein VNO78_09191 [Psophocarpus tetragonolobus]|uniref:non-specific serine/threonine protein kinase n=1 Tax=Psophocarpus tetragonolobus TaxID=3891 RepID=A0AAN9XTX0_PSOTE